MARNIGVLIRQRKLLPGLVHHRNLVFVSILSSTTSSSSSSSSSPIIPLSSSTPKLPFSNNYNNNYHSLIHSRNLRMMPTPPTRSKSDSRSRTDSGILYSFPSNVVLLGGYDYYNELGKVKDERISAVFFYTAHCCWRTAKYITNPIFFELCEQIRHITIYLFFLGRGDLGMEMRKLGVKSPEFHFYLKGEKVDELASASVPRLKKILANVYNPSGMKKSSTRAKNDGVGLSQLVEVRPK